MRVRRLHSCQLRRREKLPARAARLRSLTPPHGSHSTQKHQTTNPQVAASSLVFAAAHPAPAFPSELLLGAALGAACVAARGNLAAPVLAHALYNGAVVAAALVLKGGGGSGGAALGGAG